MRHYTLTGSTGRSPIAAAALALLAGCAGSGSVIPANVSPAPGSASSVDAGDTIPNAGIPPCKGQKNSKKYSTGPTINMKSGGTSVCVPSFGGWGGGLQFPSVVPTPQTVRLISSTTAYNSSLFPPAGSQTPMFYIQVAFSGFPTFGSNLPSGNGLVSAKITPKKTYTAELSVDIGGGLWQSLGSCYSVAKKVTLGGGIARVGSVFKNGVFREPTGVIEIFSGKLSTTQC